jgi:hypothetical protein
LSAAGITNGLVNYWPVKNGVMADLAGSIVATSSSPTYTSDRFGNANGAILVTGSTNFWTLPNGVYLYDNYTITAWVKNIACSGYNALSEICLLLFACSIRSFKFLLFFLISKLIFELLLEVTRTRSSCGRRTMVNAVIGWLRATFSATRPIYPQVIGTTWRRC